MVRSILGVKLKDKIKLTILNKRLKNKQIMAEIIRKIWDWVGHVCRLKDNRWTKIINDWDSRTKRKRGRQKARWRDTIVKFLKNNLYEKVAHDRTEWRRLREAFDQNLGLDL